MFTPQLNFALENEKNKITIPTISSMTSEELYEAVYLVRFLMVLVDDV